MKRKGIILAGGTGSRLHPLTSVVSKQLMPVYDKPMIYYPIATLMQAGITHIAIITTEADKDKFSALLGNGKKWGINITFITQPSPDGLAQAFILAESFLDGSPSALILGDNLFYGHELVKSLRSACNANKGATVFGYHVSNPSEYGVVEFNTDGRVISIQEKPKTPLSNYAVPGLYFFDENAPKIAANVTPSARGELEITDVIQHYLDLESLNVEIMGRGTAWLDTGTHDSLMNAALFIQTIEKRQGLKINCPEEIAYRLGYISKEELLNLAAPLVKSGYGEYLINLTSHRVF